MEVDMAERSPRLSALLAGLQAGMLGACAMLAWQGAASVWLQRGFWSFPNLMATAFHGTAAVRPDFGGTTFSGLALCLMVYSAFGAVVVLGLRAARVPPSRALLTSVAAGIAWYYISFHGLWRGVTPLISLLHVERVTLLGHVIYGIVLGRFPRYLPRPPAAQQEPEPAAPETEEVEDATCSPRTDGGDDLGGAGA